MIAAACQRWRDRRDSYRPAGEPIRTAAYDVATITDDTTPRRFVEAHHYSGSYPAARERFGLYCGAELVGVAVFSVPCHPGVISNWFPFEDWRAGLELGRFVLLDRVPGNAESWFYARCREILAREGYLGIVSFSDPVPRRAADGRVAFCGHVGTIYQASNGVLAGRGKGQCAYLLPNGRTWHRRNRGKIIKRQRGWREAAAELERWGADPASGGTEAERRAWLNGALSKVTRPLRHPGNLRYLWGLNRRVSRKLPKSDPYPKVAAA